MMRSRLILIVVVSLFLSLSFTAPLAAQDEGSPEPLGLRPDAPTYALHGPYWVGTQTFVVEDETEPLDVRVWYPAINSSGAEEAMIYVVHWSKYVYEGFDSSQTSDIAGHALDEAMPDTDGAPYPLVVFSHGSGTEPAWYAWLLEHLASYGFVVIAPDHSEIVDATSSDFGRTTIARPQALVRALDYAETLTASDGALAGMIDMEKVAVAGQSYGGYTALAAAGARIDMTAYGERCDALPADDPEAWLCFLLPFEDEMAQLAGNDPAPEGLWPTMGDPRIDVLITIAGDSYMFGDAGLAEITIPVLAIGGTNDTATPYAWGVRPTYDQVSSEQKILATFEGADHFIELTSCEDAPSIAEMGFYYFCSDPVWDVNRAHDLTNHFTTAFLLDTLAGDAEAAAALAPDAVSFPGILYEAEGF